MSITRNGKIARLPRLVRVELNDRLRDGKPGKELVQWLNGLPQVRGVLEREFGGKPIRQQNLSQWKKGGYAEWLAREEAMETTTSFVCDMAKWDCMERPPLTDVLAFSIASRYVLEIDQLEEANGRERWRMLRQMCSDVAELRRGDHSAQRLGLERKRVAAQEQDSLTKWKRKIVLGMETLWKFVQKDPKAKAAFYELFSHVKHPLDPTESDLFRPNPTESDQIRPNEINS